MRVSRRNTRIQRHRSVKALVDPTSQAEREAPVTVVEARCYCERQDVLVPVDFPRKGKTLCCGSEDCYRIARSLGMGHLCAVGEVVTGKVVPLHRRKAKQ